MEEKEKKSFGDILWIIFDVFRYPVLFAALIFCVHMLVMTIDYDFIARGGARIKFHYSVAVGMGAFVLASLIPGTIKKNIKWFMTFTHELIHIIFAFLCFRKVYTFNVDMKDSHVYFSPGKIKIHGHGLGYKLITLAPYCVPLFTILLLPWRFTSGVDTAFLAVIDFLIGFTYAFHIRCWMSQIRFNQTDITGPGTVKSLLIISCVIILGLCFIILTPSSGVVPAYNHLFKQFAPSILASYKHIIGSVIYSVLG